MSPSPPANGTKRPAANEHCVLPRQRSRQDSCSSSVSSVAESPAISDGDDEAMSSQDDTLDWQTTKSNIKERFCFLYKNQILSDVQFIVGTPPSPPIPAHKLILAASSAVFDAMFNGPLATKNTMISLPDVEVPAFEAFLRFLYSDEVQICPETVMTVLYTAKKYAVPALEGKCCSFLKKALCPDNAFMLLTQARLFDEPLLANLCLESIDKNTSEALAADGFLDVNLDTLGSVLERDTLRIREIKLFRAVVKWSEHKCEVEGLPITAANKRLVLGRAIYLIRFPLMTVEEFAQGPAQSGILSDREVVDLFLYFTINPKPDVGFVDIPRCCMTGREIVCSRFQSVESRWGYSGTSDRIRFMVDRRIFIVGFGLYGAVHTAQDYDANIAVIHTGTNRTLGSNDTTFSSDGSENTFRVMFQEPIEILPHTNYTACATLRGADSHYGTRGRIKVVVDASCGSRVTFKFLYAAGNNNGTSVEDGQIPEIIFHV